MSGLRWFTLIVVVAFAGLVLVAEQDLPDRGDNAAPANRHVSPYYIERAYHETHTPNMVTAVLADYRSYDTLGEVTVIFTAGMACLLILRRGRHDREEDDDGETSGSVEG